MRPQQLLDFLVGLGFNQAPNNTLGVHFRVSWGGLGRGTLAVMNDAAGDACLLVDTASELGRALQAQWSAGMLPTPTGALTAGMSPGQHFVFDGPSLLAFVRNFQTLP